jgi:pantoate--beta-alanine ligase
MVRLIQTAEEFLTERSKENRTVGFVPTMGNLHSGHISLLNKALEENGSVYFSIFVNPKQFGPNEDFHRYPRTLENDLALIEEASVAFPDKTIVVFAPKNPQEIFPEKNNESVSVWGLSTDLEGKIRPGHFDGVATVVKKLFDFVRPQKAYFGLKDYQQYLVVKQMVKDLALPIEIIGMPIVREASGLALSSRNQYLSSEERARATYIYRTLTEVKKLLGGKKENLSKVNAFVEDVLQDPHWDYLEIRDSETFSPEVTHSKSISILAVYRMGTTRLLDNMQAGLA